MSASGEERSIASSFLEQKVSETEEFWQDLRQSSVLTGREGEVVLEPVDEDLEEFAELTGDTNYAHVEGKAPEDTEKLAGMMEGTTDYTEAVVPESFEHSGSYRPLQQGALTPTALAYDDRLGFDGLLTSLELSFQEPVFAGLDPETADTTTITRDQGYEITAINPWIGEEYVPTQAEYQTEGVGDFSQENRKRIALLNTLVARGPVEGSARGGDIFHEAELQYPAEKGDLSVNYEASSEQVAETPLGPLKVFEVGEGTESGDFSYTETYIDADV